MGWGEAFEEECELSQSTDQQVAEALDSRSETDDESADAPGGCGASASTRTGQDNSSLIEAPRAGLALWWVQKILMAARSLRSQPFQVMAHGTKLRVVSGCTGCSAEAAVLQAGAMLRCTL